MQLSFESYLSAAFDKWKSYANQQQNLENMLRKQVTNLKFANNSTFELDYFNSRKFNIKTKLYDSPEGLWENHHIYHFNNSGLPIIDASRHTFNNVYWTGYFLYMPGETVFVEYDNAISSPDRIAWIEWENGKKKAKHFFRLQYLKDEFINTLFPDFFAKARSKDGSFLIWSTEVYNYDKVGDNIMTADYISSIPGYGFYKAEKYYSYDEKGKLRQIQSKDHNEAVRIEYSRPEMGETLTSLIHQLSDAFANVIIET